MSDTHHSHTNQPSQAMPQAGQKIILISGAGSGIGAACALELSRQGAFIILTGRREHRLQETASLLSGPSVCIAGDLSDEAHVMAVFAQAESHFGRLDVLVNCAGGGLQKPIEQISKNEWRSIFASNLDSVFLCSREALKIMKKQSSGGRIITISSIAGLFNAQKYAAYCSAKHAVSSFCRILRREARNYGIRTITFHPARIDTEFFSSYSHKPSQRQMLSAQAVAQHIAAACLHGRAQRTFFRIRNSAYRIWNAIRPLKRSQKGEN